VAFSLFGLIVFDFSTVESCGEYLLGLYEPPDALPRDYLKSAFGNRLRVKIDIFLIKIGAQHLANIFHSVSSATVSTVTHLFSKQYLYRVVLACAISS
jgi:hypothetical protein